MRAGCRGEGIINFSAILMEPPEHKRKSGRQKRDSRGIRPAAVLKLSFDYIIQKRVIMGGGGNSLIS